MSTLADREFNLEGWGSNKRLIEGPCGHCHYAVAFKEPEQNSEQNSCLEFKQVIRLEDEVDEVRTHYFIMGICPRPRCQQATIIYRQESIVLCQGYPAKDPVVLDERVIFPLTSQRADLPQEVPASQRELYREAASIEHLSANGSTFLARRILEQTLREHFGKPRAKLASLIDKFLETEQASSVLHQMMHDIREFGNIAGHPAKDLQSEWTIIDPVEASYTLDVVAEVLDHIYVKPSQRKAMRERWECKKQGITPFSQPTNQIVVGGFEPPPPEPEDDIPF